jgi:DNA-binding CsgD family transcriptional regulator
MTQNTTAPDPAALDRLIDTLPIRPFLDALGASFSSVSVLLLTIDLRIVYINDVVLEAMPDHTRDNVVGVSLHTTASAPWIQERERFVQRTVATRRRTVITDIVDGFRYCSRLATIDTPTVPLVLWTAEQIDALGLKHVRETTPPEDLFATECIDLGVLNALTDRELEVLAYMGQGLRPKDIAARISRSPSTVDRHRERIGHKLGIHDRATLIRLANLAVLEPDDITRTRIVVNPRSRVHRADNPLDAQLGSTPDTTPDPA